MYKIELNGSDWVCKDYLDEDWIWRDGEKRDTTDVRWWKAASVPGSVTDDMYRDGVIPDPYFEKNSLLSEWIPERTWIYRKGFELPDALCKEEEIYKKRFFLHFEGVDYSAQFYLNDVFLGEHHSMYTPVEFDVTDVIEPGEKNLLAVVLKKAPDEQSQVSKTRYVKTHKSRMTYWWDFCPRMIHMGIWDDVWLEVADAVRLSAPDVEISLTPDLRQAHIRGSIPVAGAETVTAELALGEKREDCQKITVLNDMAEFDLKVKEPRLWWPNGYGEQPLYTLKFTARGKDGSTDERAVRIGIRDLKFVKNETEDLSARAYTACINGRKIYLKGWNWVPIDVMYGKKRPMKQERLLRLAKEAHVNCLRVWGGGLIEREEFYDLCDEKGILLWQEFIQSSSGIENEPSADPEFLELMKQEAEHIIPRKKHHPCLALWGGGNELSGPDNGMITMEEPVIRVLADAVKRLDPSRYFLESSPTGRIFNNTLENIEKDPEGLHDVHGPWEHQGLTEQYTLYNAGTSLLSSEFGVEGMTNYDTLAKSMEESHMWPPSRDNEYYFHRGSWWNNYPLMQKCFGGKITEIRTAVKASQFLQYEGLKYAVEANRRRALCCSGTFPWQFNEPYPNNTCTCSVDYYASPKPVYYGVRKAYAPDTLTAAFASQTLDSSVRFEAEIFRQSSDGNTIPCSVHAAVVQQDGRECTSVEFAGQDIVRVEKEKAVRIGMISCMAESIKTDIFYLVLECVDENGGKMAENRYCFTKTTLAGLLELAEASVEAVLEADDTEGEWNVIVENTGKETAAGLWLEDADALDAEQDGYLYFEEDYFYLLPGEKRKVRVYSTKKQPPRIRVSGFNIADKIVKAEKEEDR